jgi:hypothetical protein
MAEVKAQKTQMSKVTLVENVNIEVSVDSLQVTRIWEGPLARWNRWHPEIQVRVGDRIIKVNGRQNCADDMLAEMISATSVLTFVVRRSSRPSTPKGWGSKAPTLPLAL